MLTPYTRSKFVERTVTSADGRTFKVLFLVAVVDGKLEAKVVAVLPVEQARISGEVREAKTLCLPSVTFLAPQAKLRTPELASVVSPYVISSFFTSQPTRAPSFSY